MLNLNCLTLMVFLKEFYFKVDFEKKQAAKIYAKSILPYVQFVSQHHVATDIVSLSIGHLLIFSKLT